MIIFGQSAGRHAARFRCRCVPVRVSICPRFPRAPRRSTLEAARRVGIPAEVVLADTGLCEDSIRVPAARVTYRAYLRMRRNVLAQPLPADFGFARRPFSISSYGMLGYAMMSCATLHQAIQIALKYYRTAGPLFELSFEFDETRPRDQRRQRIRSRSRAADAGDGGSVHYVSVAPRTARWETGRTGRGRSRLPGASTCVAVLHRVRVSRRIRCAAQPVRSRRRGARVAAGASRCGLGGDVRTVVSRIAERDRAARESCERACGTFCFRRPASCPTQRPPLRKCISANARCGAGSPTKARRFRPFSTRCVAASPPTISSSTHLSTQEIAELLGFSEATNFRRAFLRWTQRSPTSYRKQR